MRIFTHDKELAPSFDLVQPSIDFLRKYFWQTMYLSFIPSLLLTVAGVMIFDGNTLTTGSRLGTGVVIAVIAVLWTLLTAPGFAYLQTRAVAGEEVSTDEAFKAGLRKLVPYIVTSALGFILVLVGIILLIIPGLILYRAFYLSRYYVVDGNLGPIAALKQSYNDSQGVTAPLWGTIGVTVLFGLLGGMIGLLPLIGRALSLGINYLYIYAPALRYGEIVKDIPVKTKA